MNECKSKEWNGLKLKKRKKKSACVEVASTFAFG